MLTTSSSWSVQKRIRRSFQLTLDDLFLTILNFFDFLPILNHFLAHLNFIVIFECIPFALIFLINKELTLFNIILKKTTIILIVCYILPIFSFNKDSFYYSYNYNTLPMGKFPDIRVQPAECVYGRCDQVPSVLQAVEFAGIVKTKRDALLKEIGPLFNIQNFNELVRNTWIASKHMMVVFYFHFFNYFMTILIIILDNY